MAEFNSTEFNQGPLSIQYYILFKDPDTLMLRVAEGAGSNLPANVLYPDSDYMLMFLTTSGPITTRFRTPPTTNYDGLGG